jgi:phage shock protein PspC (stress-responsive transcriptional regulator)
MSSPKKLYRISASGRIAGVCAGLADYFDTDVTLVRLMWVVLSIFPGGLVGGLIAYIAAWAIMPDSIAETPTGAAGRRLTRSSMDRKVAGVCGGIAEYMAVDSTAIRLLWVVLTVIPGAILFGILAYLVAWFIMPGESASHGIVTPSVA